MWQLLIVTVLAWRGVHSTPCSSSTYGTDFYFGIMEHMDRCCHLPPNKVLVDITNVSPNNTDVRVQIPYLNMDQTFTIPVEMRHTVDVNANIQTGPIYVGPRGIRISSTNMVSVMVANAFNSPYSIDSYNILPVTNIGNNYMIASYTNPRTDRVTRGSEIMVAGAFNHTNVTFYDGTRLVYTAVLNQYDVMQYRYTSLNNVGMTGFRLSADKNISVTAGAAYIGIPSANYYNYDFIATEIYPIHTWSNAYIVPPILPKRRFILRIQSDIATNVSITNGTTNNLTLSTSTSDHYFGTEPVTLTSDRPLLVSQYGLSNNADSFGGDPFMTLVPGINQYVNELTFRVPDELYGTKPYLNIIVPKAYASGLLMNSKSILSNVTSQQVPVPFDNYTVLSFPTTSGVHHIYHPVKDVRFCVLVIGTNSGNLSLHALSSGFYPGYNLDGECSSPDLTTTVSTTTTITTTTTPSVTTSSQESVLCYHCDDMSHTELCDTIRKCALNEVCFLERYVKSGRYVYRSGCLEQQVCLNQQTVHRPDVCVECCSSNYCNNKGCGDAGLPDRPQRGPVCFDCQHVFTPDECTTVTMCDSSQVCSIEEYPWGDHSHFKMGCTQQMCDPLKRSALHRVVRATPVCHACCEEDYCNRNCSRTTHGPEIIVG